MIRGLTQQHAILTSFPELPGEAWGHRAIGIHILVCPVRRFGVRDEPGWRGVEVWSSKGDQGSGRAKVLCTHPAIMKQNKTFLIELWRHFRQKDV